MSIVLIIALQYTVGCPVPVTRGVSMLSTDMYVSTKVLTDRCGLQLRESRLRKAGIAGRARMASELRDMDEDVGGLSRTLAVRTLQLEMEYIFCGLEDEALDIAQDLKGAGYLLLRCKHLS